MDLMKYGYWSIYYWLNPEASKTDNFGGLSKPSIEVIKWYNYLINFLILAFSIQLRKNFKHSHSTTTQWKQLPQITLFLFHVKMRRILIFIMNI